MQLTESTFLLYAAKNYENSHCHDVEEFEEDLKRIQYIRKLFNKYKQSGDLKERLILNHLIILYNVFGLHATDMLFMKLEGFHCYLKPFIVYLNCMPVFVRYNDNIINSELIQSDLIIEEVLRRI